MMIFNELGQSLGKANEARYFVTIHVYSFFCKRHDAYVQTPPPPN